MTLLIELIPIVAFFIAYRWGDLYVATQAGMIVSLLPLLGSWLQKKTIPTERWINVIALILLGSLTLIFRSSHFIKWKPTIVYGILAATLQFSPHAGRMTLLEKNFGESLNLPKQSWAKLNNAWAVFLCILGLLNLIVAYNTETKTWVYFKLFGSLGLTILFSIGQLVYLHYFEKKH